jgi:hypothetical protein
VRSRLRLLLDGYGRDAVDAEAFIAGATARFAGSYAVMHWNAQHLGGGWRRMWDEGVGEKIRRREAWWSTIRGGLDL